MLIPLIFFFAALAQTSGASRYHPSSQAAQGLATHTVRGLLPHGPVRFARLLQMQQIDSERRAHTDDHAIPEVWKPDFDDTWQVDRERRAQTDDRAMPEVELQDQQVFNLSERYNSLAALYNSPIKVEGRDTTLQEWFSQEDRKASSREAFGIFPPTKISWIDMRKLLHTWSGSLWESGARQLAYKRAFLDSDWEDMDQSDRQDLQKAYDWAVEEGHGANWSKVGLSANWKNVLFILQKMEADIATSQGSSHINVSSHVPSIYQPTFRHPQWSAGRRVPRHRRILESVGLLSNDPFAVGTSMASAQIVLPFPFPFVADSKKTESQIVNKNDAVKALAVFSRGQLKDDSKYPHEHPSAGLLPSRFARKRQSPLLKMVEAQLGISATRGRFGFGKRRRIGVFAIEGLAEASDISTSSAEALLAKIAKWAQSEQRLVVVARHAVRFSDGTDLTEHYMRLGFQKVEMKDGSYDLVYPGISTSDTGASTSTSDPDQSLGYQEYMVRLNPRVPDQTRGRSMPFSPGIFASVPG